MQAAAEIEEVELARATGRVRNAGERRAPGQRVQEARLADVGAPGEGDLGQLERRQHLDPLGPGDEVAGLGEEDAPGFLVEGVDLVRRAAQALRP